MSYNSKIYEQADKILSERRSIAAEELNRRNQEAEEKISGLAELKERLAKTFSRLTKMIFSGNGGADIKVLQSECIKINDEIKARLKANGFAEDYLEEHFYCEHCKDTGYINGKPCECYERLLKSIASKSLCKLSISESCGFENFNLNYYPEKPDPKKGIVPRDKMSEIFNYCKDYALNFSDESKSIFMSGKTGLGKTHLSLAIAKEVAAKGKNVVYGSAQELFRKIEKEHFSSGNEENYYDYILNCDLLIIDDLGTEFESKFNLSQIYNIINTRQNYGLPTVISTNLTGAELQERYKERVMSRIIGGYDCLFFLGDDIRQLKKNW